MKKIFLMLITIFITCNILFSQNFIFSTQEDLNSDNKEDIIKIENTENYSEFILMINDQKVTGKFNDGESNGLLQIRSRNRGISK